MWVLVIKKTECINYTLTFSILHHLKVYCFPKVELKIINSI